jgi:hypothetical protein
MLSPATMTHLPRTTQWRYSEPPQRVAPLDVTRCLSDARQPPPCTAPQWVQYFEYSEQEQKMDEERADGGACLEPNHKRFILVGKNNQWGDETQLRFALASHTGGTGHPQIDPHGNHFARAARLRRPAGRRFGWRGERDL